MAEPRGLGVRAVREGPGGLRVHRRPLRRRGGRGPGRGGGQRGGRRPRSATRVCLRRRGRPTRRSRVCGGRVWRTMSLEDKIGLALAVEAAALACPGRRDGRRERLLGRREPHRHLLEHRGGGRGRAVVLLRLRSGPRRARRTTGNRVWASAPPGTPENWMPKRRERRPAQKAAALLGARPCSDRELHRRSSTARWRPRCSPTWLRG